MPRLFLVPDEEDIGGDGEENGGGMGYGGGMHAADFSYQQQQRQLGGDGRISSSGAASGIGGGWCPSLCFNQDASCIAVAGKHGFFIYAADPFGLTFQRELQAGVLDIAPGRDGQASAASTGSDWELLMVEMLYTCNLLALVGRKRKKTIPPAAHPTASSNAYCNAQDGRGAAATAATAATCRYLHTHNAASTASSPSCSACSSLYPPSSTYGDTEDVCALWDDRQAKVVVQVQFKVPIRGVQLLKEVLLIILDEKICVYRLHDLFLLDAVSTCFNPGAICAAASQQRPRSATSPSNSEEAAPSEEQARAAAISAADATTAARPSSSKIKHSSTAVLLACPTVHRGQVQLLTYVEEGGHERSSHEENDATGGSKDVLTICAHDNPVAFVCLSADGQLLGTASTRGTLFRIFSTASGALLLQLRRGSLPAQISCVAFSPCNSYFACCSSTGTAHIYKLQPQLQQETVGRQRFPYVAAEEKGGSKMHENERFPRSSSPATEDDGVGSATMQMTNRRVNGSSHSSSSGFYAMLAPFSPQSQADRSFAQFK